MNTDSEDISMLAEIETVPREVTEEELEQEFPVMTLRNMVMFPSVVMPITAGHRTTLKLVNAALKNSSSLKELFFKTTFNSFRVGRRPSVISITTDGKITMLCKVITGKS